MAWSIFSANASGLAKLNGRYSVGMNVEVDGTLISELLSPINSICGIPINPMGGIVSAPVTKASICLRLIIISPTARPESKK